MKIRIHLLAFMLLISGLSMTTKASAKEHASAAVIEQQEARVAQLRQRVDQIKAMDFKSMSSDQKAAARHELKDMKKELRSMDPTVIYISGGALILIIILLILIL